MKTNSRLILNHIFWRGLYYFSILLLNIGIARFFAAEKSGQIFYIVNNLAFVILIVSISLESGSVHYIASGNLSASQMARFCGIWAITTSLFGIAGWGTALYYTGSVYLVEPGFLIASFLFILGVLLTTYFTALFYARKEFGLPNKILFSINGILLLLLILGKNQPIVRNQFILIYFSFFFLQGLCLLISFFRSQTVVSESPMPSKHLLNKVFQYSMSALAANVIYFLVNRVDYWLVQNYCTANDLGNYIQASKLAQMLYIVPSILASTLFPIFSARKKSENVYQVTSAIRVLLLINIMLCIGIVCTGWYVFPVLFGQSFHTMYLLFVLLIPGLLCVTMNYPLTTWFSSDKRIGVNIRGSVLALLVVCSGDVILLPRYGIRAAPVVSSAGFICYYCYTVFIFRSEFPLSLKELLIIRKSDINRILHTIRNKTPETGTDFPIA